ncbi:hypothetical protein GLX27_001639 [Malassezia furfur]|uniref:CN hydrolase domain-containing protein n=1 Tax=Malassezia furfur TaxID=55194 RepID=A0ABY8EQG6_MALFU|nr:hypothetical protein CBS14141_000703 [Malassezia furfur]WFD46995.1 hypothetical protein GLX27_001639 [Malassezia furfur]
MRVASVQFAPQPGKCEENAAHIRAMLKSVAPGSLDLLVLPEMALTGYLFDSFDHIAPLLELPYRGEGATYALATSLAKQLGCYVVAGFPERMSPEALEDCQLAQGLVDARTPQALEAATSTYLPKVRDQAFNSAMLVDPQGNLANVFRKHFLYEADTPWADEGRGFSYVDVPRLGRICVAICMDLNPYLLDSDFEKYELAHYCDKNQIDLLVLPMNWLLPEEEHEPYRADPSLNQPSVATINYWVARCIPLWVPGMGEPGHEGHRTTLIAANRTGSEKDTIFAGSSSVISFRAGDQANLLGAAGCRDDAVLTVEVPM